MDYALATAILDFWVAITLGYYTETEDGVTLSTPDEDYHYKDAESAAEGCIETIRQWLDRNS